LINQNLQELVLGRVSLRVLVLGELHHELNEKEN
jgi:hypothetical protein